MSNYDQKLVIYERIQPKNHGRLSKTCSIYQYFDYILVLPECFWGLTLSAPTPSNRGENDPDLGLQRAKIRNLGLKVTEVFQCPYKENGRPPYSVI